MSPCPNPGPGRSRSHTSRSVQKHRRTRTALAAYRLARRRGDTCTSTRILGELLTNEQAAIRRRACRRAPNWAIDEIVSDTLASAIRSQPNARTPEEFAAWLRTITDRRIAEATDRRRREKEAADALAEQHSSCGRTGRKLGCESHQQTGAAANRAADEQNAANSRLEHHANRPYQEHQSAPSDYARVEDRATLVKALGKLSKRDQQVVWMTLVEGRSASEVTTAIPSLTADNAYAIVSRCRRSLAKALDCSSTLPSTKPRA